MLIQKHNHVYPHIHTFILSMKNVRRRVDTNLSNKKHILKYEIGI